MVAGLVARARRLLRPRVVRGVSGRGAPRRALMLYTASAFLPWARPHRHQNVGQQRALAAALAEENYAVDAADFDLQGAHGLAPRYDLVVDLHPRPQPVYAGRLATGALRIAYMTGSDPDFSNASERARLDDLERRRGVRLAPRRQVADWHGRTLEGFDAMFYLGDDVTLETYAHLRLPPVHRLPNNGYDVEPTDPALRDPRRFLFLGSSGQVHKGLDLLLELFAREPGLRLDVCGALGNEPDFGAAYRRELLETQSISVHGSFDVLSGSFRELQARCGTMIIPSCAEGQCGTVTVAMGFGLPCAVSRHCGFCEPELWRFADCRLETLRRDVHALAAQSRAELASRSAATHALFRRAYTPAHYAAAVRAALRATLALRREGASA